MLLHITAVDVLINIFMRILINKQNNGHHMWVHVVNRRVFSRSNKYTF